MTKHYLPIDFNTADEADGMIDSICNTMARNLCWISLSGALMLASGCAHLTGPVGKPAVGNQQASATQASAPPSFMANRVGSPGAQGAVVQTGGIAQAGAAGQVGAVRQAVGQVGDAPTAGAVIPVAAGGENTPHVARQFPSNTTTTPPSYNFTPPPGPPLQPGSTITPPVATPFPTVGGVDPYAPAPVAAVPGGPRIREADLVINGFPARTGRIMLGGAVNSDAGLTGQLTIDERNFDICRFPTSFRDLISGNAFRGAGQTFRIEAAPGTDFKRYTMQFADPNLFGYKPVSMSISGFLYDRRFNDWDEERLGGRLAFGYRVTPDLSVTAGISGQNVDITNPRLVGEPELDAVLGDNALYSGEVALTHDSRNSPIQASRGHFFNFKYEQVFGDYEYPRFELEYRKYWLVAARADDSGKQTISYSTQVGFSGTDTPLFENFFAGGYATIRGFEFRGASPVGVGGVEIGGRFQWLNTIEYMFPITADDAFRGVAFVDFGTVERSVTIKSENYRVAPGLGLRVAIPMLGPAPLAFDFAYPVTKADTDEKRLFSFYMSLIR